MPRLPTVVRRPARAIRRRLPMGGASRLKVGRFVAPKDLRPLEPDELAATEAFHRVYYESWAGGRTGGREKDRGTIALSWFGYRTLKCPLDLWTYQEILVETRPDLVVECGTRHGGSAYYIAAILDLLGHGRVLTIDIDGGQGPARPPAHHVPAGILDRPRDPRAGPPAGRRQEDDGHPRFRSRAARTSRRSSPSTPTSCPSAVT